MRTPPRLCRSTQRTQTSYACCIKGYSLYYDDDSCIIRRLRENTNCPLTLLAVTNRQKATRKPQATVSFMSLLEPPFLLLSICSFALPWCFPREREY